MAKQGLQPAPDLLQAQAGELTRITLPSHLLQQQQQAGKVAGEMAHSTVHQLYSFSAQCNDQLDCSTASPSSSDGTHKAKATACMAAASEAVESYKHGKAAAAASVQASRLSTQMAVHSLQRQRVKAIAAGPSKAKETSNLVSGGCRRGAADSAQPSFAHQYFAQSRNSKVPAGCSLEFSFFCGSVCGMTLDAFLSPDLQDG
jgi:hypothetical protein